MNGSIDGYTLFRGAVAIAGWAFAGDGPPPMLEFRFEGGAHRFAPEWFASEDVARHYGPRAGRCRFDVVLPGIGATERGGTLWAVPTRGKPALLATVGGGVLSSADAVVDDFMRSLQRIWKPRVLEVGARARSGIARRDLLPAAATYIGCDILPGPNVDIVCDAHALSAAVPPASVDAVMAWSVLEHLLMPWKFVLELNKVMAPGALGLFTTHQCWPLHDAPWDYFRYSDRAWAGLLNAATGFEIVSAAMGDPAYIVAANVRPTTAFGWDPAGFLSSNVLFRKIGETTLEWPVDLAAITTEAYPA